MSNDIGKIAWRFGKAFFVPLGLTAITVSFMRGGFALFSDMSRETVAVMLVIAVWTGFTAAVREDDE